MCTVLLGKQSNVVYRIPCSCGQVYIEETKQRLEMRPKEHQDVCERGMMEKSTVEEYTCESHYPIHWEETTALDQGRGQELLVKEALHIQMTPSEECFNRDGGLEVPGCLTAVMRRQGERRNSHQHLTSDDVVCFSVRECLKLHRLGQKLKVNCTKRQCFQEGSTTFWIRSAHLCMRYVAVFIFWSPQCS